MRKLIVLSLLLFGLNALGQSTLFPLKSYRPDLYEPCKVNRLEELYLQGNITQNTLPYFMTNYATDTVWGYFVVDKPLKIQDKNFHIIVNEQGKVTKSTMTPSDVDCFKFYMQHDTVSFLSLKLQAKQWAAIKRGDTDSIYTTPLNDNIRDNTYNYKLAHELWNDRMSLYRVYWNTQLNKKTDFIIYRNQLFLYSYEYFLDKGIISKEISRQAFYSRTPIEWIKVINATFDIYYNKKGK